MKVIRVHNRYQQPGGEDAVFEAEAKLLRDHGHDAHELVVTNDFIGASPSPVQRVRLAGQTIWSRSGQQLVSDAVAEFGPDVVHFDNTLPLISPAAYSAARKRGVAVVQTLHNYRLLCPSATLFHRGEIYEKNLGKLVPIAAMMDGVYRDSRSQTAVVAAMLVAHRLWGTWRRDVDRYIALTEFGRQKFIEGGLPADRIAVKPNFVADDVGGNLVSSQRESHLLFVGRLSPEKGITPLLEAAGRTSAPVRIAGDGPLADLVQQEAARRDNLTVLGRLDRESVQAEMAAAQALVFPSLWYEAFGLVIVEAFANGLPVIVSRLGAMAEIVEDGVTGLLVEPGNADDLACKMTWAVAHPAEMGEMGRNARREYEAKYTPERNYEMLMAIYEDAIAHRRNHP